MTKSSLESYTSTEIFGTFLTMLISSFLGLALGRLTNNFMNRLQGQQEPPTKGKSLTFVGIHLCLIITIFFFAYTFIRIQYRDMKNWILQTIEGFLFASLFIETQARLISNINIIIP